MLAVASYPVGSVLSHFWFTARKCVCIACYYSVLRFECRITSLRVFYARSSVSCMCFVCMFVRMPGYSGCAPYS